MGITVNENRIMNNNQNRPHKVGNKVKAVSGSWGMREVMVERLCEVGIDRRRVRVSGNDNECYRKNYDLIDWRR